MGVKKCKVVFIGVMMLQCSLRTIGDALAASCALFFVNIDDLSFHGILFREILHDDVFGFLAGRKSDRDRRPGRTFDGGLLPFSQDH